MKINELSNLWVGRNAVEDFTVLICALDEEEAAKVAESYRTDSNMEGRFDISELDNLDVKFDCDYVLTYADGV